MTIDNTISFRTDGVDLILAGKKTAAVVQMGPQLEAFYFDAIDGPHVFYTLNGGRQLHTSSWIIDNYPCGKEGDIVVARGREDIKLRIKAIWFGQVADLTQNVWREVGLSDLSRESIIRYWDSFREGKEYKWDKNPWVWVIEFELVEGRKREMTIDQTQEIAHD